MTIRIRVSQIRRAGIGVWKAGIAAAAGLVTLYILADDYLLGILDAREPTVETPASPEPAPTHPELREIIGEFKKNRTFADTLAEQGFSNQEIHRMIERTRPVHNLARIRAQTPYWLRVTPEGRFHDFRIPVDDDRYLTIYSHEDDFVPVLKKFAFEMRLEPVAATIEDSLFLAVTRAGEEDRLAVDLADIFASHIDFYTDIQRGDSFRMLVEKKFLDGKFVRYGSIAAADIVNQGKRLQGFRFSVESGKFGYYAPDGKSLRKALLKSPLKFGRITSRFSHGRLHPILKVVRPHLGVDYGAPAGTPVIAVGNGMVASAGNNGGSGKMVSLRHAGGLETQYLHLSRIAVRPGRRVSQGDVIGYVGSTGLATGPHLDFRLIQKGKYVNPTRFVFPPAPPVPKPAFTRFVAVRDKLQAQLEQIRF